MCPYLLLVQSVCPVSPSSSLVTVISSLEVAVVVRLACSVTLTRPDTVLLPAPEGDLVINERLQSPPLSCQSLSKISDPWN